MRAGDRQRLVYFVSPIWPTSRSPALGTFVRTIATGLQSNGWSVDTAAVGRAHLVGLAGKVERYVRVVLGCLSLAFRARGIVFVHLPTWFSIFLWPAVFLRGMLLVVNLHGSDIHGRKALARLFWPLTRALILRARLVVVPSAAFAQAARRQLGDINLFVSPSGGVPAAFFAAGRTRTRSERTTLGYVSRIVANKGWAHYLSALKAMVERGHDCLGIIVGDGPDVPAMKQSIYALGLAERCRFLGALDHDELPGVFCAIDLLLFTSLIDSTDSLGLVALEALSCGVPVVARDTEVTREYVTPGVNGELVDQWTAEAFADGAEILLQSPAMGRPEVVAATVSRFEHSVVARELSRRLELLLGRI